MSFEVRINQQQIPPIITLRNNNTGAEAEIYTFGGLLNAFYIPVKMNRQNVVDGFSSVADAQKNITHGFNSAKLSPFVCRMYKGNYSFNQTNYQVNKHWLNQHAIHGLVYDGVYTISHTETSETFASVTLTHPYKGTDEGYPFPFEITLIWKLETGNKLTITTKIIHHNAQAIPIADGWHPYFTLGDTVDNCELQFNSIQQLEYDRDLLPTGKKIEDTRFVQGTSLRNISLDNLFELDPLGKQPQCTLSNHVLSLTIEPDKSYPILQIYTPEHRKSIAIENLSGAPDNFNNGMGLILLPPHQPKIFTTGYQIAVL